MLLGIEATFQNILYKNKANEEFGSLKLGDFIYKSMDNIEKYRFHIIQREDKPYNNTQEVFDDLKKLENTVISKSSRLFDDFQKDANKDIFADDNTLGKLFNKIKSIKNIQDKNILNIKFDVINNLRRKIYHPKPCGNIKQAILLLPIKKPSLTQEIIIQDIKDIKNEITDFLNMLNKLI